MYILRSQYSLYSPEAIYATINGQPPLENQTYVQNGINVV